MTDKSNANQSTFCSMLWNHQFLGPDGNVKPCCRFSMPPGVNFNIKDANTLDEIFNNEFMQSVRQDSFKGVRNPGCVKCWQEEDAGKKMSLRQNYNRDVPLLKELHEDMDLDTPMITWLELSFSNRCNLRCRMCGPMFSTNWYKDWKDVKEFVPGAGKLGYNADDESIDRIISRKNQDNTVDVNKLNSILPNIRHLKMTGGEPFLIPEFKEIVKRIVEYGNAHQVYLNYSTNGTVKPSQELQELWKHFQEVQIATSIDGVGPVIEYQRYPTKWSDIESTVKYLMQLSHDLPLRVGNRPTITIYNLLDVPQITNWWAEMMNKYYIEHFSETAWLNHTHAGFPECLSITAMPKWAKRIAVERLQNAPTQSQQKSWNHLIKYMQSLDEWQRYKHDFQQYTATLDRKRNESFARVIPELAYMLEEK